jgi:hypothetical protein
MLNNRKTPRMRYNKEPRLDVLYGEPKDEESINILGENLKINVK